MRQHQTHWCIWLFPALCLLYLEFPIHTDATGNCPSGRYSNNVNTTQRYPPSPTADSYSWSGGLATTNTLLVSAVDTSANYATGSYTVVCSSSNGVSDGELTNTAGSIFDYKVDSLYQMLWYSDYVNKYHATTGIYTGAKTLGGKSGEWIYIHLPVSIVLTRYVIDAGLTLPVRNPQRWHVLGSSDAQTWTLLDSQDYSTGTSYPYATNLKYTSTTFTNSTQYSYFALVIGAIGKEAGDSTTGTNLQEWEIWGYEPCLSCNTGTYSTASGASSETTCANCTAGTYYTGVGGLTCGNCSAGTYSNTAATTCRLCAAGTYSTGTSQPLASTCSSCPTGTYTTGLGQVTVDVCRESADYCAPGRYTGATSAARRYPPTPTAGIYSWVGGTSATNTLTVSTSNTAAEYGLGGYTVTCSSSVAVGPSNNAGTMFNHDTNADYTTIWYSQYINTYHASDGHYMGSRTLGGKSGEWIYIKFPNPVKLTQYTIVPCAQTPKRAPQKWYVLGSPDAVTWTQIDSQDYYTTNYAYDTQQTYTKSNIDTPYVYSYFALVTNAVGQWNGATNGLNIQEWQLWGYEVACMTCTPGTYSTGAGMGSNATCSDCSAGSYSNNTAASTCLHCASGTYSTAMKAQSNATCTQCGAGTYFTGSGATSAATCALCGPGTFSTAMGAGAGCTACVAGTYSVASGATTAGTCTNCTACSVFATQVALCSTGSATDTTACTCNGGYSGTGTTCSPCPANSWCVGQVSTPCPQFSSSQALAYSQHQCLCNSGFFGNGSISSTSPCALCFAGFYCAGGNANLSEACPLNSISEPGAHAAEQCYCPAGYYGSNGSSCAVCPPNDYCASGTVSPCPDNSYAPQGSSKIQDCQCNAGFYAADGVSAAEGCTRCPLNSYCTASSLTPTPCVAHGVTATMQTTGSDYCYCDRGYMGTNNSQCMQCAEGQWCWNGLAGTCPANSTSPVLSSYLANCSCNAGYYVANMVTTGSCSICQAGTYALAGSTGCVLCAPGTYSTASGAPTSAKCQNCAAGTYSTGAGHSTTCTPCLANSFCRPATTTPEPCPLHTWSAPGASSKLDCACDKGFRCRYTKRITVILTLNCTLEDFNNNIGNVRTEMIAAIAAAAHVDPSQVVINGVLPHSLARHRGDARRISVTVSGATGMEKLQRCRAVAAYEWGEAHDVRAITVNRGWEL